MSAQQEKSDLKTFVGEPHYDESNDGLNVTITLTAPGDPSSTGVSATIHYTLSKSYPKGTCKIHLEALVGAPKGEREKLSTFLADVVSHNKDNLGQMFVSARACMDALASIAAVSSSPYVAYWENQWLPPPVDPNNPRAPLINQIPGAAAAAKERRGRGRRDSYDSYYSDSDDEDEGHEPLLHYRVGGYHPANVEDVLHSTYTLKAKVGWGRFSTVWLALDNSTGAHVAVKIQKANASKDALEEIRMVGAITKLDEHAQFSIVQLIDHFQHQGPYGTHTVMVYELLGENLLKFIEKYHDSKELKVKMAVVRHITRQCLIGLDFLHRVAGMVHTDIKPENIAFAWSLKRASLPPQPYPVPVKDYVIPAPKVRDSDSKKGGRRGRNRKSKHGKKGGNEEADTNTNNDDKAAEAAAASEAPATGPGSAGFTWPPSAMPPAGLPNAGLETEQARQAMLYANFSAKIVDLGNCHPIDTPLRGDIQTRQYRSPEVILGHKYHANADVWSLACVIFELLTGEYLFDPEEGPRFSEDDDHLVIIEQTLGKIPEHMKRDGRGAKRIFDSKGDYRKVRRDKIPAVWPLEDVLSNKHGLAREDAEMIASFLRPMLEIDPTKRCSAQEALNHPWVSEPFDASDVTDADLAWEFVDVPDDDGAESDGEDLPDKRVPGRRKELRFKKPE